MSFILIRRCPVCPAIGCLTQDLLAVLGSEMHLYPTVKDGSKGEFTVLLDGVIMYEKGDGLLPTKDDVAAAVRAAVEVGASG